MTQWSPWNWIAYCSIGISAFGIALGAIWQRNQAMLERLPSFFSSSLWSFVPLLFFFIATGIFIARLFFASESEVTATAPTAALIEKSELRMHFYGDERQPTRISDVNVWRWYYLRNIFISIEKETGKQSKSVISTFFISFDRPTKVGTLDVRSPDFQVPQHEIKEFTNRFAIISFSGELPAGSLEIETY